MADEVMLDCRGLAKAFATKSVIESFSFEVRRGEIVGLLGPNGAGKTTLIRMILDLFPPDAGEVLLMGERLNGAMRDKVGYLPEERGLYKKGRLGETLEYLAMLHGVPPNVAQQRVHDALKELDYLTYYKRRIMELSKGMTQRAQFIAASAHKPVFMVLDEPFSGLDPVGVQWALQTIRKYQSEGATILLSAHQMAMVEKMCDRVVMVHRGRRVLYGTLAEIRAKWPTGVARVQTAEDLSARGFAEALGVRRLDDGTWEVALRDQAPEAVLARLVSEGVAVRAFEPLDATLEDIFLDVVHGEPELPRMDAVPT